MSFRVKGKFPEIDFNKSRQQIHEYMTRYVTDALKTWVIATSDVVPVWSGAAKASFIKAANIAEFSIEINPVHEPHRIDLGISESTTELIATPDGRYGWTWSSDLAHIGIVEDRVSFIAAGESALRNLEPPTLPPPVMK